MSDGNASDGVLKSEEKLNSLANAASAYLRSAMHQPVDWQEWGEAAFEKAIREDKPILLDIGIAVLTSTYSTFFKLRFRHNVPSDSFIVPCIRLPRTSN